jgi:hypothetical protein
MSSLLHNQLLGLHPHLIIKKNIINANNKLVVHPSIMNGFGLNHSSHISEELHVPGFVISKFQSI